MYSLTRSLFAVAALLPAVVPNGDLIGSLATPQGTQRTPLTPQVAQQILTIAERARADTLGASLEAVRVFRRALLDNYKIFSNCTPPPSGPFWHCTFGPKSWYAEQLAAALRDGKSLTTVEARDEIVFVIVAIDTTASAPEVLTIEQGEGDQPSEPAPNYRVVTPFERTNPTMEVEEASGKVVMRLASAFHVRADDIDLHSNGAHLKWRGASLWISAAAMDDTRFR